MTRLKVKGFDGLERDLRSNSIVNTNKSEFSIYMARVRAREKQGDEIRNAVKEINNLKAELREIKDLLRGVVKK
jgi:hypothetical protein